MKKKFTFYIDEELMKKFKLKCLDIDLKYSFSIEKLIKEFLESCKKR